MFFVPSAHVVLAANGLKAQRGIALFHCLILLAVKCFFVPSAHVVLAANGLKAQRAHSPGQAAQSVPTVGVGIGQDRM